MTAPNALDTVGNAVADVHASAVVDSLVIVEHTVQPKIAAMFVRVDC
ncbi:MAG: hypothetical protein L0Z53_05390 [Acidobacteriales bacterium]|nr:hypothetical protein [Terriglobales bacterium]